MRLPRLKRAPQAQLPGFRLTTRDRAILQAVSTYRALTTAQIEALFFAPPGELAAASSTRCQQRLKLLYHHGLVDRHEQLTSITEGRKPLVYFLTAKGVALVAESLDHAPNQSDGHPVRLPTSSFHLTHLLQTNDVRVAINRAAALNTWTVTTWLDDRTLKSRHAKDYVAIPGPQGRPKRVAIVPDGYFALDIGKRLSGHFFLELDRGTETISSGIWNRRDWLRRTEAYLAYYRSGAFTERYGARNLRVLTVTTGEKPLRRLKEAAERANASNMFWFAVFAQATDPRQVLTTPIWQVVGKSGEHALTE